MNICTYVKRNCKGERTIMTTKRNIAARTVALVMALVIALGILSGCSAAVKDPVIAQVGSEKIYYSDYYSTYNSYAMFATWMGYDVSTTEGLHKFQDYIMDMLVSSAVVLYEAKQNNITLTEEDEADIQKSIDDGIESALSGYKSKVDSSITDENEIRNKEMELLLADLKANGMTYDQYVANLKESYTEYKLAEKMTEQVKSAASISDDEVRAYYDEQITKQKEAYDKTPEDYYTAYDAYIKGSATVRPVYIPEGYTKVKHILIKFPDETSASSTPTQSDDEEEKKDVEAIAAELESKLDKDDIDIDEFNKLIEQYGEDPGMKEGSKYAEEGYLVHESIIDKYYEGFAEAALELKEVGDISGRVETEAGYHYIMLVEKVESRTLDFDDDLAEEIHEKLLTDKENEIFNEQVKKWLEEVSVKKYPSRIRYVGTNQAGS